IDWTRDLHFHTKTTIDTLDYSGTDWNAGSKVVMACCGKPLRQLARELPTGISLPAGFKNPRLAQPGVVAIEGPKFTGKESYAQAQALADGLRSQDWEQVPLIILCDDADFLQQTDNNFLWATFTRANPSHDIYGVDSFTEFKHWGCRGPLIIDARIKPHHAPPLIPDAAVSNKVDKLFAKSGSLYGMQ
ncbi:MAG: 3-octaprenyl-4-hydroxybenzoate carboxy-lyase, partial [Bacteroidota bacterium]